MKTEKNWNIERLEERNLMAADIGFDRGHLLPPPPRTEFGPPAIVGQASPQIIARDTSQTETNRRESRESNGSELIIPSSPAESRSIDGAGNNLENPELGIAGSQLLRVAGSDYADGISELAGEDRPSAREVSNALAKQDPDASGNERQLSAFVYVWGQFLDHDIDLSLSGDSESAFVEVPTDDPYFDPDGTGSQFIPFMRSLFDTSTGDSVDNPREQINAITAYVDGSQVYGSDQATADSLRTFVGGKLLTSEGDLLPMDEYGNFLAGDIRASENIELTSMQTLFVREHNWWAEQIALQNPSLSDEEIYQQARAIVIAEIQVITYEEFLPALLGENAIPDYEGYDPSVNPGIANEFSTAAYRLGHSLLNDDIEFFGNDGRAVRDEIELAEAFFNPGLLQETGIDAILKYSASSQSQEIDNQIVDSVRNFLFGEPGEGGLDLASLNIQRGRDHGLADYNSVREAYGLDRVSSFLEITSDVELQQTLADLYMTVDDIDLWVGALAEDHVEGSSVGELTRAIVVDQFTRLRDGDRFWYENSFSTGDVSQLKLTTLSDVIQRNTTVTNLQDNVFFMSATVSGTVFADGNRAGSQRTGEQGLAGVAVELLDDEGSVVDSTTTDSRGHYSFGNFLETGDYQVRVLRPTASGTVAETTDVLISVGGQVAKNLDFGVDGRMQGKVGHLRHERQSRPGPRELAFERPSGNELDSVIEELARDSIKQARRKPR
ncbi:peroxidase family protein [Bythopirellula polymerisocia]|uniref:Serine-aspartate repeat-containing protein G n=1 Tax=Bythopirellula polymerisocia TaxID=2528003 RepID=A0A5C6CYL9_9BACT|nr:peroxidase family protein [Bythopirellula polymerisocia]TWU30033.1 Serine-aspartate repeat-containing protein G precursor [Bythopirellula polymerisocia]